MRRLMLTTTLLSGLLLSTAGIAAAGPVRAQFGAGAFGLPWNAGKSTIEAKYPGGTWDTDEKGRDRYCAASRQTLRHRQARALAPSRPGPSRGSPRRR